MPQALIDTAYAEAARFHALPLENKLAVKVDEHNIGYMPIARKPPPNAAAQGKKPSQNEAYFLRREKTPDHPDVLSNRRFHAMNKWPAEAAIPGFRANMLAYMGTMEALCRKLVRLYALALDLPETFFDACFAEPHVIQRMSRYPAIDGADQSVNSLVAHTDSGFMTLLPPNRVQGLEINLPDGRWLEAPGVPDAFVVNGGDILHRWTNERFLSTPHRVRNLSGAAALCRAVLLRSRPRHRDRVPAVLPVGRAAGEVSADQVRRLRAVVRRPALRAHGQGAGADRGRHRAGCARHLALAELKP